jgi:hypothetical protein
MVEEFQKLNLSDNSLRIDQVFESLGDLLDCYFAFGGVVVGRADYTVCTMTNLFDVFELLFDEESSA